MKTIKLTEQSSLQALLEENAGEEVVVLRDGHAVALLVPFDDDDLDLYAREHDPAFIASIARARQQSAAGKSVGHDELKKQLGVE